MSFWLEVRYLFCRWHVYEDIRRYCVKYVRHFKDKMQLSRTNRFIDEFKARKIMECYTYDSDNHGQTTTSRIERSHAAYRSKSSIVPSLKDSYIQHRIHKQNWIRTLRSNAADARNRTPLAAQAMPELRSLVGKITSPVCFK